MSTENAYRWDESDWYASQGYPGHGDDDTDDQDAYASHGQGEDWGVNHDFLEGRDKEAVIAHRMLREVAPLLCSTTLWRTPNREHKGGRIGSLFAWLFEPDDEWFAADPAAMHAENREIELSEPELHVPKTVAAETGRKPSGQYRYRKRVNPEAGYISGGESTGVVIQDVDEETFLRVVDVYLTTKHLTPKRETEIRQFATSAKREGNDRDVDILERVIWMADNTDHSGGSEHGE